MVLSIYYTPLFIFLQRPHTFLCIFLYYAFYKGILEQGLYCIYFLFKFLYALRLKNFGNLKSIIIKPKKKIHIKIRPKRNLFFYNVKYLDEKNNTLKIKLIHLLYEYTTYYIEITKKIKKNIEKFLFYLIKNYKDIKFKFNFFLDIIIKLFIFQIINFNLPNPIFKRLSISFLFKNSYNKILFLLFNFLGSVCSYFIIIKYIYKLISWFKFKFYLKKRESIMYNLVNRVINSFKNKDSLDIYFLYIYLVFFLVFLSRTPLPLFTFNFQRTGLKSITFNDRRIIVNRSIFSNVEKEKKYIDINEVEKENKKERAKKLKGGESEIEESDVEDEEELNLLNITEEDNKDLVDIFFYTNRWNRPIRYIKNKQFDKFVRIEMSQLFFNVSKFDNKQNLLYTFSPNLSAFFKLIKKNTRYLKKIYPYERFNFKKKINNFENDFKKRIESLDKSKKLNLFEITNRFFDKEKKALLKLDDILKGNFYDEYKEKINNLNIPNSYIIQNNENELDKITHLNIPNSYIIQNNENEKAIKKYIYENLPPILKFLKKKKKYEDTQKFIIEEKKLTRWICSLKDDIEFLLLRSKKITGLKCRVLRPLILYTEPPKDEKNKKSEEKNKKIKDKKTKIEYKISLRKLKLACISDSLNLNKKTEDKKVDKNDFFGYNFEKRIEEDEKKKGELHDIRFSELYDLNRFFVRGALRNQKRKEIPLKTPDFVTYRSPSSPIFILDREEEDRPGTLKYNDLLDFYGPENVDIFQQILIKKEQDFLNLIEFRKRASRNAAWDSTYGIVNIFRTCCLISQLYIRIWIKIPFLIIVKTIVRLVLFQPFEYNKDMFYFNKEQYIMCTYNGIELVENKLPEDWMSEGIQIKIVNPFRLRPWYDKKSEKEEKVKFKRRDNYTFLDMKGHETIIISSEKFEELLKQNFYKLVNIEIGKKIYEINYNIIGLINILKYNIKKIIYTFIYVLFFFYKNIINIKFLIFRFIIYLFNKILKQLKQFIFKIVSVISKIREIISIISKSKIIEYLSKSKLITIIYKSFNKRNLKKKLLSENYIKNKYKIKKNADIKKKIINYDIEIKKIYNKINILKQKISNINTKKKLKKKIKYFNIVIYLKIKVIKTLKHFKHIYRYNRFIYIYIIFKFKYFIYYVKVNNIKFISEKNAKIFNFIKMIFISKLHNNIKEELDIASNIIYLSIKNYPQNITISQAYLLYSILFKHNNFINLNNLRILFSNIGFSWESFIISSNNFIPENFVNKKNIKKNYQSINLLKQYSLNEKVLPIKLTIQNQKNNENLSIQNILFKNEKKHFDSDEFIKQNNETDKLIKIIIKKRKQQEKERKSKEEKERKDKEKKEKEEEERRKKGKIKSAEEKRKEEEEYNKKKEEEERKKREIQKKKRQEKLIINKGKKYFRRHLVKKNLHKLEQKILPEFNFHKNKVYLYNIVITAPNNILLNLRLKQIKYLQNPWLFPINQFFNTKIEDIHQQIYLTKVSEFDNDETKNKNNKISDKEEFNKISDNEEINKISDKEEINTISDKDENNISEKSEKNKISDIDENKIDSRKGDFSKALSIINKKYNNYQIELTSEVRSFLNFLFTRLPLTLRLIDQIYFTDNSDLKKQRKEIFYKLLFQSIQFKKCNKNLVVLHLFFGQKYDFKRIIKDEEFLYADRQRFTWLSIGIIPNYFINNKFIIHQIISLSLNNKINKEKTNIISPETILTSKFRRKLRIFKTFKTNYKNKDNLNKFKIIKYQDNNLNKKDNTKFFTKLLWPNYSLEDLACINRYCLNTSNGSRFSMLRFKFYPKI
uniref:hypothetical protein RF1 n=1 Tax=Prosopanche panguanensis TaxID=2952649 RepID=UPI002113D363|nr:hypothetical protein RF1 [Prosopanche panguanensis]USN93711.1 hypothetical protein RF1 [Prosopanche panguanensis]